jgi:DNA repair exonuclease SbcCD ATPase subunit
MSASDRFTELKQRVEQADGEIKEAAAQDRAELSATAEQARKAADDRAAELRAKAQDTSDKVQSSWDQHVQRIRTRIQEKKTEHDIDSAKRHAEWAEADALDAVDFAEAAAVEAEYAVLDAAVARRNADELAASA